jgi:hypothetical protein
MKGSLSWGMPRSSSYSRLESIDGLGSSPTGSGSSVTEDAMAKTSVSKPCRLMCMGVECLVLSVCDSKESSNDGFQTL